MAFTRKYSICRTTHRAFVGCFFCKVLPVAILFAIHADAQQSGSRQPNIAVIQELVQRIGRSIMLESHAQPGDSLSITVAQGDDAAIVGGALFHAFREFGGKVFLGNDSLHRTMYQVSVSAYHIRVQYEDMFSDGLFGAKKVSRTVSALLTCEVVNSATHEVKYSSSPSLVTTDTVLVGDIPMLERGVSASGRSELPAGGFFDRALEPLIIIGATGVAVFLFFHVRS